jgi:Proteasome subunit
MEPAVVGNVISSILYERRFGPYFVEPVVAGLQGPEKKPYICAMDLIGAPVFADDFVVSGTSSQALYGLAETLYKPDMVCSLSCSRSRSFSCAQTSSHPLCLSPAIRLLVVLSCGYVRVYVCLCVSLLSYSRSSTNRRKRTSSRQSLSVCSLQ